jgi:hypothetical protein
MELEKTDECHNLYSSPSIIGFIKSRNMRWAGHVAHMEAMRKTYKVMIGKLEGKRPFGRKANNKMDLKEIVWKVVIGFIWLRIGAGDGLLLTQ